MVIVKLLGGFSNQLFQYAVGRHLAYLNKDVLKLDIELFRGEFKDIYRLNKLNIIESIATLDEIHHLKNLDTSSFLIRGSRKIGIPSPYNKKSHHREKLLNPYVFNPRILNLKGDIYLEGWLQNEKYFKNVRHIILNDYQLKNGLRDQNMECLYRIKKTESVSLHIRRGEYVVNKHFDVLPLEYYYKAIDYIKLNTGNPDIFIFTDDPDWVLNNFKNIKEYNLVSSNSDKASFYHTQYDYEDLCLMKHCKHHIIANSTFSWWGAWLSDNPNKIIIAPQKWFANSVAQRNYENGSFIPKEWMKI